eukprot:g6116.t1
MEEARKRVAVIGYTGTIGKHVVEALEDYNNGRTFEIVRAGRKGPQKVDLERTTSISEFLKKVGKLDAIISCATSQYWGPLEKLDRKSLDFSFRNKLGGQIDLAIQSLAHLNDNGVVILTSGFLSEIALPGGIGASIVNSGLNGFVRAAATETKRGTRIVAISPGFIEESKYPDSVRKGLGEVSAKVVAKSYLRALLVGISGKVITVTSEGVDEN